MYVLGLSGGWDAPYAVVNPESELRLDIWHHDSAAVLLKNGEVIAAIEEERLNRIKHSGHRPTLAIKFCCQQANIKISDIDHIAFYADERMFNLTVIYQQLMKPNYKYYKPSARQFICHLLEEDFNETVGEEKIHFLNHHHCHAASVFYHSGFNNALVVTLDGEGDNLSGTVYCTNHPDMKKTKEFSFANSLGNYYIQVIRFLGFRPRDEYKVMGLAPYGNSKKYEKLFSNFYTLKANGEFSINKDKLYLLLSLCQPRRAHEEVLQIHKDIAAALQISLQTIVLHILRYLRENTGEENLCLAGGVIQNCVLNGEIERSGLFKNIYISPASHDAGCALGAALLVHQNYKPNLPSKKNKNVFWGYSVQPEKTKKELEKWSSYINYRKSNNITMEAAELINSGAVIGWVQGRSEFGPRALGNRSILADPRPKENRHIINKMIKTREDFRPFAPSVLKEFSDKYFNLYADAEYSFMSKTVKVKECYQEQLGAITHIDGTARVHVVEKEVNPKFWKLIHEFNQLSNIPILLNTSFNNNWEPIVDSESDSICTFLTTGLNYLVIDDFIISKNSFENNILKLYISIPKHLQLIFTRQYNESENRLINYYMLTNSHSDKFYFRTKKLITESLYEIIRYSEENHATIDNTLKKLNQVNKVNINELKKSIFSLWQQRLIILSP